MLINLLWSLLLHIKEIFGEVHIDLTTCQIFSETPIFSSSYRKSLLIGSTLFRSPKRGLKGYHCSVIHPTFDLRMRHNVVIFKLAVEAFIQKKNQKNFQSSLTKLLPRRYKDLLLLLI